MCMIAAGLTEKYGVLASDSATYCFEDKSITHQAPKTSIVNGKYLMTFVGTNMYFSNIDWAKFDLPLQNLSVYLQDYLQRTKPNIEDIIKKTTGNGEEPKPDFCAYVIGLYNKRPTMVVLNSFKNFKPSFLWATNGIKFATLYHGDDSCKDRIFKESTRFMNDIAKTKYYESRSPGLIGEILSRGIYHKSDLELSIGDKRKYAGGMVNAGYITNAGLTYPLSGLEVINGSR